MLKSVIGSRQLWALPYLVASRGGRRLVERWGSHLLISPSELAWVEGFFTRYGALAVFVGRLLRG
jgi:membrane protein DedA with SNARE-associated domain